jgi:hypothetical protein
MKKDIPEYKVEELAIAILPRTDEALIEDEMWDVYLLNLKEAPIENVLINSRGYGELEGEQMRTTILRHFFNEVGPLEAHFTFDGYMYDKRYVFVRGSISEENFTTIPVLQRRGVMIK